VAVLGLLFWVLPGGGVASAQSVKLSRSSVNFGNQAVGTTSPAFNVILTNTDTTPLAISGITASGDYSESDDCAGNVAPTLSCTLLITFIPNSAGLLSGVITLNDDASNSPQLISAKGTGVVPLTVAPSSLAFGTVAVGGTSTQAVTLTNNLTSSVTFSFTTSGDYAATGSGANPCGSSLAGHASCTLSVTFAPKNNGSINGTLTVNQTVNSTPQIVALSGSGTGGTAGPLGFSPASLSFPNTAVGITSASKTVIVTNKSTKTVTISSFPASTDYASAPGSASPCGGPLTAGNQCTITVTFDPTQSGTITGSVTFKDNAAINPQILDLTGQAIAPVSVSPASLTFAAQSLGSTSAPQTVTVTNHENAPLTINAIVASGDYGTVAIGTNPCASTLAALTSCTVGVVFNPIGRTGTILGDLTIRSNASSSPQVLNLTGTTRGLLPRFAYVPNPFDNTISTFTVNFSTGQLRHTGYILAGFQPTDVAVTPSGKFAYAANGSNGGSILAYKVNGKNGGLTPIAGSPFGTGIGPSLTVDPTGKFLYTANIGSNNVSAFTINSTTGALTEVSGSPFATDIAPTMVTIDPSGKFAYTPNINSSPGTVSGFTINSTTGALTPIPGSPFATVIDPNSLAVDPSGRFAYVASDTNKISAYSINSTTGALTPITGSPFDGGGEPFSVTVDPTGQFLYAADPGFNSVSAFTINVSTGALTAVAGSPFAAGTGPTIVRADPSGAFLYVMNKSSNDVWTYSINASSGSLSVVEKVATRTNPFSLALSKSASPSTYTPKFAYVANFNSNDVSAYTINASSGALTSIGANAAAGSFPASVTVDPSGRFAYVANESSNDVSAYTINASTGALTSVGPNLAAGTNPISVTVDPSGRFAYVANFSSNNVSAYTINASSGALTSVGPNVGAGSAPRSVTVDPSGRFVYVANDNSSDVSAYTINANTGALTSIGANLAAGSVPFSVATTGTVH
jgi:6-phosphogluconolactonase (cycloisomerase 2 family)